MPIPVHIVTGAMNSGKSALIARLCHERKDWLGLVDRLPAQAPSNLRPVSAGCPCCIGKVVLQITLVRALRETRAVRAFVELADAGHVMSLEGILGGKFLGRAVRLSRPIVLPRDCELQAVDLV